METWAEAYEFTYLAPTICRNITASERLLRVNEYWENGDPDYVDGAESIKVLVDRVKRTIAKLRAGETSLSVQSCQVYCMLYPADKTAMTGLDRTDAGISSDASTQKHGIY